LIVPALLVTHLLLFGVLRQRQKSTNGELAGSIGSLPMDVRAYSCRRGERRLCGSQFLA